MRARTALASGTAALVGILLVLHSINTHRPAPDHVFLTDMTWTEVRDAIAAGKTTAIVPTGGTEQNGPHLVLGKHHYVVREAARRIAEELGDALVAPVVDYVPEGAVSSSDGHMAFSGTITIPESVFEGLLESAARSLKRHGFRTIAFVGDSAGNQEPQARVAAKLNVEWAGDATVVHVDRYYGEPNGQSAWLRAQGESEAAIGGHAGIRDSSELMAAHPAGVREKQRVKSRSGAEAAELGYDGLPVRASRRRGETMLSLKVAAAVEQIRRAGVEP